MEVRYLNTDLEIESKSDLSRIVEEFGEDVLVHHHGEIRGHQHASFSIAGGSTDANATIDSFCDLIESLPNEAREIWDQCCSRIILFPAASLFNIIIYSLLLFALLTWFAGRKGVHPR